jgi:hypothetical protein
MERARPERVEGLVATHAHVKPATAAIDGAWFMPGAFTMYQSMNEPMKTPVVAITASPAP